MKNLNDILKRNNFQITYYPWSKEVLQNCIQDYIHEKLPVIDLDLTAKCTQCSCIYCDSKPSVGQAHPNELSIGETIKFLKEGKKLGLKWVYVCGLGEPLEDPRFFNLIEFLGDNAINTSIFTNGTLITKTVAELLHKHKVSLVIKLDTFSEQVFDKILGRHGEAKLIYQAVEYLLNAGYAQQNKNNTTDLAFSIVPTRLNLSGIPNVIKIAKENNIFPSIGELEFSGNAKIPKIYRGLALSPEEARCLKKIVDEMLWPNYKRPICPAILTSLHIDNIGNVVVDQDTGLSCKWFMLKEPRVHTIGDIRTNDLTTLLQYLKNYQYHCFKNTEKIKSCEVDYIFGGCGGNPKEVIKIRRKIVASYTEQMVPV